MSMITTFDPAPDPRWLHQQFSAIWAGQRNVEGKAKHGYRRNRHLDAATVVEVARGTSHPLHNQFDWSAPPADLLARADRLLEIARNNAF